MKYHSHPTRSGRLTVFTLLFICASALLGLSLCVSASAQDTRFTLASAVDGNGQVAGSGTSSEASISADGRFIVFSSVAADLVALPTTGRKNVFVRDLQAGTTRLASVNKDGTGGGNGSSSDPHISADGRYVAFSSFATNLVPSDPNGEGMDVYVRDMQTNTTTLVTANTGGPLTLSNASSNPSITPDGRYVAFTGTPPNMGLNVFVRDMQTNATTLVSVNNSGGPGGGYAPVISANGRVVVFQTRGDNFTQIPTPDGFINLFARDLLAGTTSLITVNDTGTGGGNLDSEFPSISADGRYVAFHSNALNLPNHLPRQLHWGIYVRDLTTGVTTPAAVPDVPSPAYFLKMAPAISADGRYVAYAYNFSDPAANENRGSVARFDRLNGVVSTLPDAGVCTGRPTPCHVIAFSPSLSADGRFVAFGEVINGSEIEAAYFGDFLSLTTTHVTTQPSIVGNVSELVTRPVISADGHSMAFQTRNDLVPQNPDSDAANIYRFTPSNPDPAGVTGLIQFGTPSFRVEENAGSVAVPVMRGTFAGASGTATVDFATANRTAQAGPDYVATSGTLTFNPGEEVKFINVPLVNDSVYEGIETFAVNLSNPTGGYALGGTNPTATVVIHDSIKPAVTISDPSVKEGEDAVFNVTLSVAAVQPISIIFLTMDGTAQLMQGDYQSTGGTLVFNPGETTKTISVKTRPDLLNEPDETFFVLLILPEDTLAVREQGTGTIRNDTTPVVQFSFTGDGFVASEAGGSAVINVSRTGGDPSIPFSVNYSTSDGTASERSDYATTLGTLRFAAGETSKTFTVFITDDLFVEPAESFNVTLSNPQGATLGSPSTASVTINSEDSTPPTPADNPINQTPFFVRQHYRDFLNREPDTSGLQFWTNEIEQCNSNQGCREVKRVNVSAAFFLSIEFQRTGMLTYLTHKAAFGPTAAGSNVAVPILYRAFERDTQTLQRGYVFGAPGADAQLEANKRAFFDEFVTRPEFVSRFAGMSNADFVSALFGNAGLSPTVGNLHISRLNASQVVPPTGSPATGVFILKRNPDGANRDVTMTLSLKNLSSAVTAVHIHGPAAAGSNAPALITLPAGEFTDFQLVLTAQQISLLVNGQLYIDVHTQNNPDGEIRAQIAQSLFRGDVLRGALDDGTLTRAQVLRIVAEFSEFGQAEFRPAFVLMEYFGYLRRDPDAAGYGFWLNKLNSFDGDYVRAEMVKAFITSDEYRRRFGP